MKVSKKAIISALVFSAALNLNACAYGPDMSYDPYAESKAAIENSIQASDAQNDSSKADESTRPETESTDGE